MSAKWDIFHGDRLETERGLTTDQVRQGLASGMIREDDLVRPMGSTLGWTPLRDMAEFKGSQTPVAPSQPLMAQFADDEEVEELEIIDELPTLPSRAEADAAPVAPFAEEPPAAPAGFPPLQAEIVDEPLMAEFAPEPEDSLEFMEDSAPPPVLPQVAKNPVAPWDEQARFEEDEVFDPLEEDEEASEFTFTRGGPETIEELDLAAMVDVAFQLVLFFFVTATTVLYKSLEVPKPNNDAPPESAVQGRGKSLDDMKSNFILVEIDPQGVIKLDHEPLPENITLDAFADRLRVARKDTDRTAMLISADFSTPHKNAVLAYDAANEIGLRIAIAKPTGAPADAGNNPPQPVRKSALDGL